MKTLSLPGSQLDADHPNNGVLIPRRYTLPKIGPWRDKLEELLQANERKPRRERLTLVRLFEELRGLGYEGGYDAIRRYAKTWAKKRGAATAEAYIPLSFSPGEAYQFDWSHEIVLIDGVTSTRRRSVQA